MPLENANLVKELDANNPAEGDSASAGAAHIRTIKKVIKTTWPNLEAAVTMTAAQLNDVAQLRIDVNNNYNNAQSRVSKAGDTMTGRLVAPEFWTPTGGTVNATRILCGGVDLLPWGIITFWIHGIDNIPPGWVLCDGRPGTLDLRNRFLVGAGDQYTTGTTGGYAIHNTATLPGGSHNHGGATAPGGAHDHGGATHPTAITVEQMPPHQHYTGAIGYSGGVEDGIGTPDAPRSYDDPKANAGPIITNVVGGAQGHSHPLSVAPEHQHLVGVEPPHTHPMQFDNRPPFTAGCWIMRHNY